MSAKAFLDTNVLIYAFASDDPRGPKAEELVAAGGVVSVQVLNEFVNVCRHKLKIDWSRIEVALDIAKNLLDPPMPLTLELHEIAIVFAREHRLPIYDSLIVAAAIAAGCPILYTEDMQHGRKIGGVIIRNPFES
jgi:predicted nucleic acid-binding protein